MATFAIRASAGWLGTDALPVDDLVVRIDGGVVSSAAPASVRSFAVDDLLEVDGFLMPALADRHVHVELAGPTALLRGGVTAARDLAWPADRIFPIADLSEVPSFDGPLVRAAGPMLTAPGGYPLRAPWAPSGTAREIRGADVAADAVRELVSMGAATIAVSLHAEPGPTPTDAELAAIADAAHAAEVPVTALAQGPGEVDRALGAGVDELAGTPYAEHLADDTIRRAARSVRIVSGLDAVGRDVAGSAGEEVPEPEVLGVALENLRRFRAAGGHVVYGSGFGAGGAGSGGGAGSAGGGVHVRELELLRAAGLSVVELLRAAILAPLVAGAPADLVVLPDSPFGDLEALRAPRLVVRGGRRVT